MNLVVKMIINPKIALVALVLSGNAFALDNAVTDSMRYKDNSLHPKWHRVLERQSIETRVGSPNYSDLLDIHALTSRYRYAEDKQDFWLTPDEMAMQGYGDCEDYAISWYYAARARGFKAEDLNILIGTMPRTKYPAEKLMELFGKKIPDTIGHAVLSVRLDGQEYILDSYDSSIKPASEFNNFKLSYRINELGWDVK